MKSGRYGNFLIMAIESNIEGWRTPATALEMRTAIMTGMMCVIWPVISDTMTQIEIVLVTAPETAAAPTTA